jgi:hypothetical protein
MGRVSTPEPLVRRGGIRSYVTRGNIGPHRRGYTEAHVSEVALIRHCGARGSMWALALPLVLT